VPYVGFATYHRATVRTRFTFCQKKKRVGTLDTQCFLSEIIRLYYVGFATYHRVTVRTRFTFCQKKKKKKGRYIRYSMFSLRDSKTLCPHG
jgi:hypothetical protein